MKTVQCVAQGPNSQSHTNTPSTPT
jgi:hypothetical protein